MSYGRVRCQVIETPASEDWMPRGQDWPRDLLPWADPYIATLMVRLERRYEWAGQDWVDEPETDHPLAADDAAFSAAFFGDDSWQDADAFMPGWQEGPGVLTSRRFMAGSPFWTMSRMDSKKTPFSADSSAVVIAKVKFTRAALCGRYLAFAHRDLLRGRGLANLAAGTVPAEPVRRWKRRQR